MYVFYLTLKHAAVVAQFSGLHNNMMDMDHYLAQSLRIERLIVRGYCSR